MRRASRLALASVCAIALATPALAQSVETTIRVEGSTDTLIPESPQDLPAAGTTVVEDDLDGDAVTVPSRSATAQLRAATAGAGLPLGFDLFDFGSGPTAFVNRIGPDAAPADFSAFWLFKVNHVASSVGSDDTLLNPGDEVLWFYGPPGIHSELDVVAPAAPVVAGERFRVTVRSFDDAGAVTPAAGATVSYAGTTTTTNAAGAATLTATAAGTQRVVATAPDSVRDSASVCGYPASDPSVCGLAGPAAPAEAPGSVAGSGPSDAVCRDDSARAATRAAQASPSASDAAYRRVQWHARVTMQRVAAMSSWLDAGIAGSDICGGALGRSAFVAGVTLEGGGPTDRASAPAPRRVALDPPPAPRGGSGARASTSLAVATRRITIEALKRVNALSSRIDGGLTGGDLREGAIGGRELAPGVRVVAASPAARGGAASNEPATSPTRVRAFVPSRASAAKDLRVAQAGLLRSSALFRGLRAGLGPEAFAPGSVGRESLSESVLP